MLILTFSIITFLFSSALSLYFFISLIYFKHLKSNNKKNENTVITQNVEVIKIIDGALVNEKESIFEFDLPEDCINLSGVYKLEFVVSGIVSEREEKITSLPTEYAVNKSILTDLNASTEESNDYPILLKLIEDVKTLQGGGEVDISQFVTQQELNGMFSFNESGELVVTINGVTKTFVPK